jgi:hypothetical protein
MKGIETLRERASGRAVLALLVVMASLYGTMLFYSMPSVTRNAPGMRLFDMSPAGYSPAYARNLLDAIGPEGRRAYLQLQLPIDFVYPGLFAAACALTLMWLFNKRFEARSKIFYLALVPAGAGLFDYLENAGIIIMLKSYPALSPGVVHMTSLFSILKSVLTVAFYILLCIGFVVLFFKRTRRRTTGGRP